MAASSPAIALPRHSIPKPRSVSSLGLAAWLPLMSVFIGIICLLYLAQASELTTTGYNIQQLLVEESNWKLRNEQISLDIATARSLAVVEGEAVERLKMVRPEQLVYLQAREAEQGQRLALSSRGDRPQAQTAGSGAREGYEGPLTPVTTVLSSLLAPRGR
jgi:hypothetical protein